MEKPDNQQHPIIPAMQRLLYIVREIHAGNAFSETDLWNAYEAGAQQLDAVRENRVAPNPLREPLELLLVHAAAVYRCFDPATPLRRVTRPRRQSMLSMLNQVMESTRSLLRTEKNAEIEINLVNALASATSMIDYLARRVPLSEDQEAATAMLDALRALLKASGDRSSGYAHMDVVPHVRCNPSPIGLEVESSVDQGKSWQTVDIYRHDTRRLQPCYQPQHGFDTQKMARAYFDLLDLRGIRYVRAPAQLIH